MDTVSNALLGEDLGRPGIDHIWGFKESENLWFDGSRKLTFGDIKHHVTSDGRKFGKVWYAMRDIGGKPGRNDTVLFNNVNAENGRNENVYAVLYDYQIEKNDLEDDVFLQKVGIDVL